VRRNTAGAISARGGRTPTPTHYPSPTRLTSRASIGSRAW
jgi:hypothetical protein